MTGMPQSIEWYLARDGQQYGPLTDGEFRKLVELGHLRTEDLVWRIGMPDWMPATELLAAHPPVPPASSHAAEAYGSAHDANDTEFNGSDTSHTGDDEALSRELALHDDAGPAPGPDLGNDGYRERAAEPRRGPETGYSTEPRGYDPLHQQHDPRQQDPRRQINDQPMDAMRAAPYHDPRPPPEWEASSSTAPERARPTQAAITEYPVRTGDRVSSSAQEPTGASDRPAQRRPLELGPGVEPALAARGPRQSGPTAGRPAAATAAPRFDRGTDLGSALDARSGLDARPVGDARPGQDGQSPRGARAGRKVPRRPADPASAASRHDDGRQSGRRSSHVLLVVLVLLVLAGAGMVAYLYRDTLAQMTGVAPSTRQTVSTTSVAPARAVVPKPSEGPGMVAVVDQAAVGSDLDAGFQKSAVWRLVKRDFPDWYVERLREAERLIAEKQPQSAIVKHMTQAMVGLRRRHADHAFAASPARVIGVAQTFHDNLVAISQRSKVACFAFISQGETSPVILDLVQDAQMAPLLDAQFSAVFDAIADGRAGPQPGGAPRKSDYDLLTTKLKERGWKEDDLALFSDANALSDAKPEQVCRLVTDWFATHLAIPDAQARHRLLIESIRPVVAG